MWAHEGLVFLLDFARSDLADELLAPLIGTLRVAINPALGSGPQGMETPKTYDTHPERPPHPALFPLETLYALQRRAVREEHLEYLRQEQHAASELIRLCNVEQLSRACNLWSDERDVPHWWDDRIASVTDEQLQELIDNARERILFITAHRMHAVSPAIGKALLRWDVRGPQL